MAFKQVRPITHSFLCLLILSLYFFTALGELMAVPNLGTRRDDDEYVVRMSFSQSDWGTSGTGIWFYI